ncbi:MAG: hypothetical protein ACTHMU_00040 [Thermomicrobiales bacterium]
MSIYPLRLTPAQYADVREHYADDWPAGDDLLDALCATGEPCDGHCGDAGCPVYEQEQRRVHAEPIDLGDDDRDAIPF